MPTNEIVEHVMGLDDRLVQVFLATFPDVPEVEIRSVSIETVAEWDSLQSVTLMTLLEEEFGITISPFDLPELGSYDSVRDYLLRAKIDER
jgi:acyl carrier protein